VNIMSDRPASLLFPANVRRDVLDQHGILRRLFDEVLGQTTACLRHSERPDLAELAASAHELRRKFHAHLGFEEKALAPVLAVADIWGPERVQALLIEHARQRREFDTIVAGIDEGWDCERLALALRSLVADLLLDMDDEEQGCLRAEVLAQDVVWR
jgi:hypothetical protein